VLTADLERAALCAKPTAHATRTASPKSRPASSTLTPIRPLPAPLRFSPGSAFPVPTRGGHVGIFRRLAHAGGARATLFAAPDLLLLDEPTNYLDLEGTLWLEDHLANYPRTVIVISHDRDLLDTSVDQILHLDRGKLTLYKGTYSSFEEQRAAREMLDAKHAKRQADERKRCRPSSTASRPRPRRRAGASRASKCWSG
jgi:hypothetical protein